MNEIKTGGGRNRAIRPAEWPVTPSLIPRLGSSPSDGRSEKPLPSFAINFPDHKSRKLAIPTSNRQDIPNGKLVGTAVTKEALSRDYFAMKASCRPVSWTAEDHTSGQNLGLNSSCVDFGQAGSSSVKPNRCKTFSQLLNVQNPSLKSNAKEKRKTLPVDDEVLGGADFAKPEFNATLKLCQELKKLGMDEGTIADGRGCERVLAKPNDFGEKAALQVNIAFEEEQYKDLISLQVPADVLVSGKQWQMRTRGQANKPRPRQRDPEPDVTQRIDEVFITEYCTARAAVSELGLGLRVQAAISPPDCAFRLYKRLQMWDS